MIYIWYRERETRKEIYRYRYRDSEIRKEKKDRYYMVRDRKTMKERER